MDLGLYLSIPFISAAIGWITNRIAIKMLFAPKKPIKIIFFTLQGVLPKRRETIAEKLSVAISKHFISQKDLEKNLHFDSSEIDDVMLSQLEKVIDDFLEKDLPQILPMASMFISDDIKRNVKKSILSKALTILPEIKEKIKQNALKKIDLDEIIRTKAKTLSFDELEDILKSVLNKELRFVEFMGGVLGFFIGIFQLLLVYSTV